MKMTPASLINAVLAIVLLSSVLFVGLTSSVSVYDPYADYDADGDIDIFDVVPMAEAYGTTGDPTRNITVTNFPEIINVTNVGFRRTLSITLAANRTITEEESFTINVSSAYDWVTVGMIAHTAERAYFDIYWIVGEVEAYMMSFSVADQSKISEKYGGPGYPVQGEAIRIYVWPVQSACTYSLGLYLSS